jgi:hypothetical protein
MPLKQPYGGNPGTLLFNFNTIYAMFQQFPVYLSSRYKLKPICTAFFIHLQSKFSGCKPSKKIQSMAMAFIKPSQLL